MQCTINRGIETTEKSVISTLTVRRDRAIITAGRDDACGRASPSVMDGRLPAALDGGFAFSVSSCSWYRDQT